MTNTLFVTMVAVNPTFVAFLSHSQTYVYGRSRAILSNFFEEQ